MGAHVYGKLMMIQQELKAPKGQYNSFAKYNYRSCEDILEAVKPLLAETKTVLSVTDRMEVVGDRIYVRAEAHLNDCEDAGEITTVAYAREEESKKGMDSSQVTGAASSYARKYALLNAYKIATGEDPDAEKSKETTTAKTPSEKRVLVENYLLKNVETCQKMLQHFNVGELSDITEKDISIIYKTYTEKKLI